MTKNEKINARKREWRKSEEQRLKMQEYNKKYRENPENLHRIKIAKEKWFKNNQEKYRGIKLKQRFGISLEIYNKMLQEQNGLCAICFEVETAKHQSGKIKNLSVDHCHKTGKIRGLLCNACNRALGYFKENTTSMTNAITYLKENNVIIKK